MLDGGEVGGGMFGSDAAFVVAEEHVHDPVQAVLDRPMASHDGAHAFSRQVQRGDVKARLTFDPAVDLAAGIDDDDAVQAGPGVALAQPAYVVDDGGGAGLDAAVVAFDGFVSTDRGVLEAVGLLLGDKKLDIGAQSALVPFRAST